MSFKVYKYHIRSWLCYKQLIPYCIINYGSSSGAINNILEPYGSLEEDMNFINTWNYFFFNFSGFALVIKHNFIDEWVHLSLSGPRRTTTSSYICSSVFVTVLFSPLKSHIQSIAFRFWHFEHEINHLKAKFRLWATSSMKTKTSVLTL